MKTMIVCVVTVVLVAVVPVTSHHSFSAFYFEDRSITVDGELVEFEYSNPHSWVHIMVTEPDGLLQRYSAEWAGVRRLRRQGIEVGTLQIGDRLIITGSPGRNSKEFRIHLRRIERPEDGWEYVQRSRRGRNRR
jgi:hypothetical protein